MFRAKSGHESFVHCGLPLQSEDPVPSRSRESPPMPRATELSLRLAIARMARLGATPPEIARQLDLPVSTVRDLTRRALQAGAGDRPLADLSPDYHHCGRHPGSAPPLREAVLDLRRQHPRWGATRIRVELVR